MKEIKKFTLCFLVMFILLVATGQIRVDLATDNYLSFLIFLFATYMHLRIDKGRSSRKIFIFYVISFFVLNIIVRFIEGWENGIIGIPNLTFILLGIISGYLIYNGTKRWRFILPACFFILALCQAFIFHPYWMNYVNFKNFTGKVYQEQKGDWKVYGNEDTLTSNEVNGKIVLFDFWNTSCAVCFTKFPILERLYQKYKDNPNVIIKAVNIPIPRDTTNMAFNIIKKKNYSFPVAIGADRIDSIFGVQFYPTTIVMRNNLIIYRGHIEEVEPTIESLLAK